MTVALKGMGLERLSRYVAMVSMLSLGMPLLAKPVLGQVIESGKLEASHLEASHLEAGELEANNLKASHLEVSHLGASHLEVGELEASSISDRLNSPRLGRLLSQNSPAGELSAPADELTPLPETAPVLPVEPVMPPSSLPGNGEQVMITEIQVVGSSVFGDREFDPIVANYEGRSLGLRDLRQVADDITELYVRSGYITSRAVLGEQTITDGVVQVRVIEGSLEDIQVEGTQRLANYVRDRVNLANRKPLNQAALESQLQLLRADPLLERIEASLRAGTGEGQSRLIVRVLEAPAVTGQLTLDTNSPPSVGVVRMGIDATYSNALGLGDQLSVSAYRNTTGGAHTYGVTYSLPLNAMNGTLQARYSPSSFELVDPALAALGVRGTASTYELTYRQPLIRQPNEELALSLGFRHRTGETLVSNFVIDATRTSAVQFGQDYLKRDQSGAWGLRSQFNLGTGLFNATDRPNGQADGQFFSWLGQVQRAQVINRDNLLLLQGSVQLSADSLLGSDQFIVGGPSSVRGYSQNARFGDNGFRASIENRLTVVHNNDGSPFAQLTPFLDVAGVWNQADNTSRQRFLVGAGAGVIMTPFENFQARLDVGIPLVKLTEAGDSPQDVFVYFNMDYRF
ncbi:MAG: ShlB/FhaC/HecB family hemolysin secretion/activation protein [Phormidesmis sp. RL_2_1]|nr:ShlB/FhaC/HecB family hemolysin secretion/activation protein [Phormidesmis sp. RL_2_1]